MKKTASASIYISIGCLLVQTTFGDVLFTTFGSNDSYDGSRVKSINWDIFSPDPTADPMGLGAAARFQFGSGSYALSSVSLAMGYTQGTNNLAISIVADNGGKPTGALLETVVSHPTDITGSSQIVTYRSSLEPVMAGGSSYWLVVQPVDLNVANGANNCAYEWWIGWNLPLGPAGLRQFNFSTQDWDPWQIFQNDLVPGFRIEGFAVPEPSSFSLLLIGACLVGLRLRRKP